MKRFNKRRNQKQRRNIKRQAVKQKYGINSKVSYYKQLVDFQLIRKQGSGGLSYHNVLADFSTYADMCMFTVSPNTSAFWASALAFTISDLPNITTLSQMWDEFKLKAVSLSFQPSASTNGQFSSSVGVFLHTITDSDDWAEPDCHDATAAVATIRAWKARPSYRCRNLIRMGKPVKVYKPLTQASFVYANYDAVTPPYYNPAYSVNKSRWTDFAYGSDAEHYGIKFILEFVNTYASNATVVMRIDPTYYYGVKTRIQ